MSEIISFMKTPGYQYGMATIGTAMSAFGKYQEGQIKKETYEYNEALARRKAGIEEKQSREKFKRLAGRQRALYAKAGVDLTSGSPLLIMSDTAAEAEEEARLIRAGGRAEAKKFGMYGDAAEKTGILEATSMFLTGMSKIGEEVRKSKRIKIGSQYSYDYSEW